MAKIVLIYPKFPVTLNLNIPIGLLHLGTYLKSKGFEVRLIDCNIEMKFNDLIADEVKNAYCIGISSMTTQVPEARKIGIFIKNEVGLKRAPIVFGGVHPTLYPQQVMQEPYIDFVVIGEGELTMLTLLEAIENGDRKKLTDIAGIAYRDDHNTTQLNTNKNVFNYEDMPEFDYTLLSSKVIEAYKREDTYFPLLTSRGCPFQCAFCINVVTKNTKWRAFSALRTVLEIERVTRLGFKKIWVWDENFFTSKKRIGEILDLLESKNIVLDAWVEGRADYVRPNYLNIDILKRLKRNGFNRIGFGYESGSQRILDYLHKEITVEQILNSAEECTRAGIRITASFMIGLPIEKAEDVKATVKVIGQLTDICTTCGISGPILYRPYPGSKIYYDCINSGWKEPGNLKEWSDRVEGDFSSVPNPYKLPWIKDPAIVNLVHFYTYTLSTSLKNLFLMFKEFCKMTKKSNYFLIFGSISLILLSLVGKIRYKLGFFRFLIEKKIFHKYHPNLDY